MRTSWISNPSAPVVAMLLLCLGPQVEAGDWPQFRGPDRNGISQETGLLGQWPPAGPRVLWRRPLGEGYSGLSLVDGRIYTMFAQSKDEFIGAFDSAGGEELWRVRTDDSWRDRMGNGPRATPTVHGSTVYALSAQGKLYAIRAKDGEVLWSHDLKQDYGARVPQWGVSASPLIEGNLVLVQVGAKDALMVAFHKTTGKEAWRAGSGGAGYAAPLAITVGGVRQVVFFTADSLYGVAPRDGTVLWKTPWKTDWDVNAAMPLFVAPDKLFVSSGYDTGAAMFRIEVEDGQPSARELWRARDMKNQFSSSVLRENYIYGFDNKTLKCVDVKSGETRWRARDLGHGSLIYADGQLIVLGERGQLVLIEATPKAYREKGRMQVFKGKTWTLPTLSDGRLYLRDEHELVALDVAG